MKRLIVNADDFGRSSGINRGVAQAHDNGIVTSATLMVGLPGAAEAAELARARPNLGLGLHVAVSGAPPVLPAARIPSLVDERGQLRSKLDHIDNADPREVLAEARAQFRRFRELTGRLPTHFDSHHHAHTRGPVLEALVTLAWEIGLPVRSPSDEVRQRLRHEGLATNDAFIDGFHAEGATSDNLADLLGRVELGTSELMCHPAVVDEELRAASGYAEPRGRELEALIQVDVRAVVQACGLQLVNYSALQQT